MDSGTRNDLLPYVTFLLHYPGQFPISAGVVDRYPPEMPEIKFPCLSLTLSLPTSVAAKFLKKRKRSDTGKGVTGK